MPYAKDDASRPIPEAVSQCPRPASLIPQSHRQLLWP